MDDMKEWTIMFYFAGDNQLAPIVVSQLKGIKDAGFQENTDVLVYFDPNELGVPTKIYDVNRKRKLEGMTNSRKPRTLIGDGADSFVRNMEEDNVDPKTIITSNRPASSAISKALISQNEINAEKALENFLGFCREAHPARHYILFLVGHGMVVGNDTFLLDDNPISAITLKKLGHILHTFTTDVVKENGSFELLGLHSCSMSAIEVAYQLKGTAKFMVASEGPTFLGDWHYRQLLKKSFVFAEAKNVAQRAARKQGVDQDEAESDLKILELVKSLYFLTLHSATDYLHAGYSHDLALCNLDPESFEDITGSIQNLVALLKKGLNESSPKDGSAATELGKRIKELVLLAHWEAQSYWGESYTDLFDFCRCLRERCDPEGDLKDLHTSCSDVMKKLTPIKSDDISERFKSLIIYSIHFGWEFQYSHGFSVYFPWSRPIETVSNGSEDAGRAAPEKFEHEQKGALERYEEYAFTEELGTDSWLSFLETYFNETERNPRRKEDRSIKLRADAFELRADAFAEAEESFTFDLLSRLDKVGGRLNKVGGREGADCTCPSIKNYPKDKYPKNAKGKMKKNLPTFSMSEEALEAFVSDEVE
jgi:hypothetical protein